MCIAEGRGGLAITRHEIPIRRRRGHLGRRKIQTNPTAPIEPKEDHRPVCPDRLPVRPIANMPVERRERCSRRTPAGSWVHGWTLHADPTRATTQPRRSASDGNLSDELRITGCAEHRRVSGHDLGRGEEDRTCTIPLAAVCPGGVAEPSWYGPCHFRTTCGFRYGRGPLVSSQYGQAKTNGPVAGVVSKPHHIEVDWFCSAASTPSGVSFNPYFMRHSSPRASAFQGRHRPS